ncbi:2735_t:CDS:1, partial [Ambispora leptoticha]
GDNIEVVKASLNDLTIKKPDKIRNLIDKPNGFTYDLKESLSKLPSISSTSSQQSLPIIKYNELDESSAKITNLPMTNTNSINSIKETERPTELAITQFIIKSSTSTEMIDDQTTTLNESMFPPSKSIPIPNRTSSKLGSNGIASIPIQHSGSAPSLAAPSLNSHAHAFVPRSPAVNNMNLAFADLSKNGKYDHSSTEDDEDEQKFIYT